MEVYVSRKEEYQEYVKEVRRKASESRQRFESGDIGKIEYSFYLSCLWSKASAKFPEWIPRTSISSLLEIEVKRYFSERNKH